MKFRKKPREIDATQWWRNGDHPNDNVKPIKESEKQNEIFFTEGNVVRYFRRPDISGARRCNHCDKPMQDHGWIDTLEGGHIVCPSDWIITGIKGEIYPCKDQVFRESYEPVLD